MANILCRSFHRLNITRTGALASKYSTTLHQNINNDYFPPTLHESSAPPLNYEPNMRLSPLPSPNIDLGIPRGIKSIIENPLNDTLRSIIDPMKLPLQPKVDKIPEKSFDLPTPGIIIEKHAVRMIRIRQRKMKVHKLKKWRRKNKVLWFTILKRRAIKEEKALRVELLAKINAADQFNAKQYVDSRLAALDHVRFPHKYRGQILPEATIRELMREKQEKYDFKKNIPKLTLDD